LISFEEGDGGEEVEECDDDGLELRARLKLIAREITLPSSGFEHASWQCVPSPNHSMETLPSELVVKIFECLPMTTLATIAPVSKRWRAYTTKLLYTSIDHPDWKPKRVSICLHALSSSHNSTLSTVVRHLDLRLWSIDPAFSLLLVEALTQTKHVVKLRLSMSEAFAHHFEAHLLQRGIIALDSIGEGQPELWSEQFLPHLEELELSSGYKPFQLAASRPVRCVSSPTHMEYHALQCLLPYFRQSRGPLQIMHFNLTGRDTNAASKALRMTARMLPYLTDVFFNVFVSRRAHVRCLF
jgi:F-box-like